uniref:D-Ala-D-Ala dipeptidase n=1 Tax=Panagrolaimus sp. ES5 TaxID=591445 RepID=A0AC34FJ65_9BILA
MWKCLFYSAVFILSVGVYICHASPIPDPLIPLKELHPNLLPEDFVYLKDIDPTIMQNMIYYNKENFVGSRILGYKAPWAILTKSAAVALKKIQAELKKDGYSLIIYDAYRPAKASAYFQKWGKNFADQKMKEHFYPYISKKEIFNGYLAKKSMHSCGISSHNCSNLIEPKFVKRRQYLREIMERNGFQAYSKEWWHYTLKNEPYKNKFFDFDIL